MDGLRWSCTHIGRDGMGLDDDIFTQNGLLSATCPSSTYHNYQPCAIPRLTFTDLQISHTHPFQLPLPFVLQACASPTSSASSSDPSPCSRFGTLPPTPSTSEAEFALPSSRLNVSSPPSSHLATCHCQAQQFPFNVSIQRRRMLYICFPFATLQKLNATAYTTFSIFFIGYRKSQFTNPMKVNPIQSGTTKRIL